MTIRVETLARGDHSRITQPRRVLARTDVEWRALWAAHTGPDTPEPAVDFGARMVAAVFAGARPSSGFDVAITGARVEGDAVVLLVDEQHPSDASLTSQVTTSPFHIVTLPRHDGPVQFGSDGQRAARAASSVIAGRRRHEPAPSSTGLSPPVAGALAYLAGPFSGALLLGVERTSRFVKFHAWQAMVGLGVLACLALLLLLLAFVMLVMSPTIFWTMLWLAAVTAGAWVVVWAICLIQAYRGRLWKIPIAGDFAERRAGLSR